MNINLQVFDLITFLIVSIYLVATFFGGDLGAPKSKVSIIRWIALVLMSLYWWFNLSNWQDYVGYYYFFRFLMYILLIDAVIWSFRYKENIIKQIGVMVYMYIFGLISGIAQYLFVNDLRFMHYWGWDNHLGRLVGTWFDPGFAGLIISLGFLMTLPLISYSKKPSLLVLIATVGGLICLGLTFSRASYLAFGAGILVWVLLKRKILTGVGLIVGLSIVVLMAPKTEGEGVNLARTSTINFRITNWQQTLNFWKDNPTIGIGFNNMGLIENAHKVIGLGQNNANHGADNSLLFLLATSGIMGTLGYGTLVGLVVYVLLKIKIDAHEGWRGLIFQHLTVITICSMVTLFVHGMFHNSFFYAPAMIWIGILLGISFTAGRLESRSR